MPILGTPIALGGAEIRNRLYRAPVLEGAGSGPDAADIYRKTFVENAAAGVGLIIQGNSCIYDEGRTAPGMTVVSTREKMLALSQMTKAVHSHGASIFIQLGHGGIFAMETWHEPYATERRRPIIAISQPPLFMRAAFAGTPLKILSTDDLYSMANHYGDVALWAREAGYDGIQLASGNAKLLHQIVSPFYNKRDDEFGGSVENRARILRLIREAVAERAGPEFPCTVKVAVGEKALPMAPHITFDDGVRICRLVEEWGYDAVTPVEVSVFPDSALTRGGIPSSLWANKAIAQRFEAAAPTTTRRAVVIGGYALGGLVNPFRPLWNEKIFKAVKAVVSIPVFAVGGIRTAQEVNSILDGGDADMVGIGRPFYAEPDLAARILAGDAEPRRCRNSNLCVPPQMLGMKGTCFNPAVQKT